MNLSTRFQKYTFSLVLFCFAAALHYQFRKAIGGENFLFFYPSLFLSALFGGFGPGLLSVILSSLFTWFFLFPSHVLDQSQASTVLIEFTVFVGTGILFSGFSIIFGNLKEKTEILANDLKSSLNNANSIIDANPIPLLVMNSDFIISEANKSFYEKFHVTSQETIGRSLNELGRGQWNIESLRGLIKQTLKEGVEFQGFEMESDFSTVGRKFMILSCRRILLAGSGATVVLLAFEDFTEKRKQEQDLIVSQAKYESLIVSAYDGIMVVRRDGTIELANPQLEKMFGYDPGELVNQDYKVLIADHDQQKHEGYHDQYMSNPIKRSMGKGLDLVGRRKDGTVFPIDVSLSPFKTNSDVYVNSTVRDITEQKKLEEVRKNLLVRERELREEAVNANRIKDDFLATLSHELRTPLTTILGWSQQLLTMNFEPAIKEALSVIERNAYTQGQLINDLLDVSRIQSGKMVLDICVVDLVHVIEEAVVSARVLAEKKSIQIGMEFPSSTCKVSADASRLQQVFWNLLVNAIKFTSHGGEILIKLSILDLPKSKTAQIQIKDSGIGIKAEFLAHIFKRFSQADSSMTRVHGGLGLGLSIVKSLVELHHGSVAVESEGEGNGATFTIYLPVEMNKNKIEDEIKKHNGQQKISERLDGINILVVDDAVDNLTLFSVMLKTLGAVVQTALSAKEGLQAIKDHRPDILISDISMPGEDGYSLIKKIRALGVDQGGAIPAIALTAYAAAEDIQNAITAGFSAHMPKPVEFPKLSKLIARLVNLEKI